MYRNRLRSRGPWPSSTNHASALMTMIVIVMKGTVPDVFGLRTPVCFFGRSGGAGGSQALDDAAQVAVANRLPMFAERDDGPIDLFDLDRSDAKPDRIAATLHR